MEQANYNVLEPKKVVIVEDDRVTQVKISSYVEALGFEVKGIFDRVEDLHPLDNFKNIDLFLLDINLAGPKTGVYLAEQVNNQFGTPVIFISATKDEELIKKAYRSNIYGFIKKPFNKSELENALKILDVRRTYELKIKDYETRISEQEKAAILGEHASTLIHDLNNFTTMIYISLQNLDLAISSYREQGRLDVPRVERSISNGMLGVDKLIKMSKRYRHLFFKTNSEAATEFKLTDFFNDIRRIFNSRLKDSGAELFWLCDEDLVVETKEVTLMQVLVNLIANSLYEIVDKNLNERWVKIEVSSIQDNIKMRLTDSGKGIPPEVSKNIFTSGFSTKENGEYEGAGVGLSLVKKSVEEELRGTIKYLPSEEFTTFEVIFPKVWNP